MVASRSVPAWRAAAALAREFSLPRDMAVEIACRIAATSPRPVADIRSLRGSCRAMRAACADRAVGRCVALEREADALRWSSDGGRYGYPALVRALARAGNPEACFITGLALAFARRRAGAAASWAKRLGVAAAAGHRAAAYALAVLFYGTGSSEARDVAKRYIREVEGEAPAAGEQAGGPHGAERTNRECVRLRAQVAEAVRQVTWNVGKSRGPVPAAVVLPEDGHRCAGAGCGVPEAWSDWAVFCSDECRIRHEYAAFFTLVRPPYP